MLPGEGAGKEQGGGNADKPHINLENATMRNYAETISAHDWIVEARQGYANFVDELSARLDAVDAARDQRIAEICGGDRQLLDDDEEQAAFCPHESLALRCEADDHEWQNDAADYAADCEAAVLAADLARRAEFSNAMAEYRSWGRTRQEGSARYWEADPDMQALAGDMARAAG